MARKKAKVDVRGGERLKCLLEKNNMSQTELSRKTGISKYWINRMVNGNGNITQAVAEEIARAISPEDSKSVEEWLTVKSGANEISITIGVDEIRDMVIKMISEEIVDMVMKKGEK